MREDAARQMCFEVGTALTLASGRVRGAANAVVKQRVWYCAGNRRARFESAGCRGTRD